MEMSIIVPLYNEEKRSSAFLKELIRFRNSHLKDCEIVFVNDGSTDKTLDLIRSLTGKEEKTKIISYRKNRGKGAAVREGVFGSQGEKIIFIDADGSIPTDQIPEMVRNLDVYDAVVGTRYLERTQVEQPAYRHFTGTIFNLYVNLLFSLDIHDTLCGFKGFKEDVARDLFRDLMSNRWTFDVEIFYKIRKKRYKLHQLPIKWVHKNGSKIGMFGPLKIAFELLGLRMKVKHQK
ncbi:hypothetical protein CMO89_04490 [Candidatus Woesearchaeota archaeon]|nr:hypothetical protein [Candidatus Woesearchaeota archaeon]|tara:strand:- start:5317 stop:6018 length:702 start_codon:yes stop_codon:yes gene_type:complete